MEASFLVDLLDGRATSGLLTLVILRAGPVAEIRNTKGVLGSRRRN